MSKLNGPEQLEVPHTYSELVDYLAQMNDFHLSKILSDELGGKELSGGKSAPGKLSPLNFAKLATQVSLRRYELLREQQVLAKEQDKAMQAAFNQVLRNQNFAPRTLMQAILGDSYGEEALQKIFSQLQQPLTSEETKKNVAKDIVDNFPVQALEALYPMYKAYMENELEENRGKTDEQRKEDFLGQVFFVMESLVFSTGEVDTEKSKNISINMRDLRKEGLFNELIKKLDEKVDKVEKGKDLPTVYLQPIDEPDQVKLMRDKIEVANKKAVSAQVSHENTKHLTTILGVIAEKGDKASVKSLIDKEMFQVTLDVSNQFSANDANLKKPYAILVSDLNNQVEEAKQAKLTDMLKEALPLNNPQMNKALIEAGANFDGKVKQKRTFMEKLTAHGLNIFKAIQTWNEPKEVSIREILAKNDDCKKLMSEIDTAKKIVENVTKPVSKPEINLDSQQVYSPQKEGQKRAQSVPEEPKASVSTLTPPKSKNF